MKGFKLFALAAIAAVCMAGTAARAEVQININFGPEPVCPYGYYNYAPYRCAPLGYYGPTWFVGGVFLGAGPWFHGPIGFRGHIDRDFDPRFGYRGVFPRRGEHADWGLHRGWERHFRGNEYRHEYRHDNGHHYGQYKDRGEGHGNGRGNGHGRDKEHGHGHGHGHDR